MKKSHNIPLSCYDMSVLYHVDSSGINRREAMLLYLAFHITCKGKTQIMIGCFITFNNVANPLLSANISKYKLKGYCYYSKWYFSMFHYYKKKLFFAPNTGFWVQATYTVLDSVMLQTQIFGSNHHKIDIVARLKLFAPWPRPIAMSPWTHLLHHIALIVHDFFLISVIPLVFPCISFFKAWWMWVIVSPTLA